MADTDTKELQVKPKQEVASPAEQTRPGLIFTPEVDIFETDKEIVLMADVPGVTSENLEIDLRDNVLTITAGTKAPAGEEKEQPILTEYAVGTYFRQFTLSEVVDQKKIDAKLNDGVLRLTLPKVEKATPRKIQVHSA